MIDDVTLTKRHPAVRAFSIDAVEPGTASQTYAFPIRGWIIGRDTEIRLIDARSQGRTVGMSPVDVLRPDVGVLYPDDQGATTCGFSLNVDSLRLPESFLVSVTAHTEGRDPIPLATIAGSRAPLPANDQLMVPLIICTPTGRTGTTWLTYALGCHPRIMQYGAFEGPEPRLAGYWTSIFSALASPSSYWRAIYPRLERPHWWLGNWEASEGVLPDAAAVPLGKVGVEALAQFARHRADGFYRGLARECGKPRATHFVEKWLPDLGSHRTMTTLFPELIEVVLVRDPRDVVCSVIAFSDQRPGTALVRERPGLDDDFLASVTRSYRMTRALLRGDGRNPILVRYEDLVSEPVPTLRKILRHAGLRRSPEVLQTMAEASAPGMAVHRTTPTAEESIGRWRKELTATDQDRLTAAFESVLSSFGYDP